MASDTIKDRKILDALQRAVEFENTKGRQRTCFYCGEAYGIADGHFASVAEDIPDEWTCSKGHTVTSRGWEWHDVAQSYHQVQRLLSMGLARIKYKSNKHTDYILVDRKKITDILSQSLGPRYKAGPRVEAEIFSDIIGHHDIKKIMARAILSEWPVHLLLVGPPASAKTMFQLTLESMLPDAYFVDGANLTGPGLAEMLFENDTRYLIIDEMEEMSREDLGTLASFMQTGRLIETKYSRTRSRELNLSVIGSCNDTSKLSQKLLSRFLCVHFPEYAYTEFVQICISVLLQQETPLDISQKIANFVWHDIKSRDIRDAIKISNLVKNEADLQWVLALYQRGILSQH